MDSESDASNRPDGPIVTHAAAQGQPDAKRQPTVSIPRHALRIALRQAELAADEINAKLRDAEIERDQLARRLGVQQGIVDRLTGERDYRSLHVRSLEAAARE